MSKKTRPRYFSIASMNWFFLSFLSGSVNAGGYLACHRFVTHVTGFATLVGTGAATSDWDSVFEAATVPLFFLLGSITSGLLIDKRMHQGKKPHYILVMALVALCLFVSAIGGHLGAFGDFGELPTMHQEYILLCLLCGASGLQNAAITSNSNYAVRTTHLTGITTDLGIGLVRAFSHPMKSEKHYQEMQRNWLRIGCISSFIAGSLVGVVLFMEYKYLGFLLPAFLSVYEIIIASRYRSIFMARHRWLHGEI